jgi:16S rRNA (guanine527-N7)-methyltransferase
MHADQIAELLASFLDRRLSEAQLAAVSTHLDLLLRWNERINLTSVRRPEEIVTRHFGESFFLAQNLFPPDWRGSVADLGSGAGFPGVPITIYAPDAQVTLIESNNKKATFLRELTRALKLPGISVFAGRAEDFRFEHGAAPDVVTLRAVEKFDAAVRVAASLLRDRAQADADRKPRRLAMLVGAGQVEAAKALVKDFTWQSPVAMPGSGNRVLLIGNLSGQESAK